MTKPHITTPRDRLSARYKALHKQLASELKQQPEPSKQDRKRATSHDFRARGE